jgi:hypothetical protein
MAGLIVMDSDLEIGNMIFLQPDYTLVCFSRNKKLSFLRWQSQKKFLK